MSEFLNYINRLSKCKNIIPKTAVHIVIGNESCDLDSTISSLVWAYFLSKHEDDSHKTIPKIFPVLNVLSSEFPLRTENCYVLQQFGVDWEKLIYKDMVNLRKFQSETNLKITLVDHHILSKENEYLVPSITEIFDHRPLDPSANWNNEKVRVNLKEVGSCATLIANEIYHRNEQTFCEISAKLLYNAIVFDTIGFSPIAKKAKDLDLRMCQMLEEKFHIKPAHKDLFDELWHAHNDVSHLTTQQLLAKDLKVVDKVLIPGLPMLVNKFLKTPNVMKTLQLFCAERNSSVIVLIGLEAENGVVCRDLALYSPENNDLLTIIQNNLLNCVDLQLVEINVNESHLKYFRQDNVELSRKQILPIIKKSLREHQAKQTY